MTESKYQSKISKALLKEKGWLVNGIFTKDGESDLQGGFPFKDSLFYIAIEVKTEKDYYRIMSGVKVIKEDGIELYKIVDDKKLKEHESLQIAKINLIRKRNGLGLIAWNYSQVKEYAEGVLNGRNISRE